MSVKGVLLIGESCELQDTVGGVLEANTTRTTVVIKLKKDVDIMLSPMALESAQLFLEVGTCDKWKKNLYSPVHEIVL